MTREEIRSKAKQRRIKEVARNKMLILLIVTFVIVIGSIVYGTIFASAHASSGESDMQYKYYKSIVIEEGDSLWSIASEYCDEHYTDTQTYIDELISMNQLKSNKIYAGQHLVVAYYDNQFK